MSSRTDTRSGHAPARLPWWGVALAAVGFAVLLMLVAAPVGAHAAPAAGPLAEFIERLPWWLARLSAYLW